MYAEVRIIGLDSIIHNSGDGMVPNDWNAELAQIHKKKGTNLTDSDKRRERLLATINSLWRDGADRPAIPEPALRACIEGGARKLKQGPLVREGLIVTKSHFEYDEERYGTTLDEIGERAQYTTGVVRSRNRVLATRAKFELPWACRFEVEFDEELVDLEKLETWLGIAGRRLGIGDWRPERSGSHGRFGLDYVREVEVAVPEAEAAG